VEKKIAYQTGIDEIVDTLDVDIKKGLSESEVVKRRSDFGRNELQAAKKTSVLSLFFSQFKDILVVVLIFAALVSIVVHYLDGNTKVLKGSEKISYYKQNCQIINDRVSGTSLDKSSDNKFCTASTGLFVKNAIDPEIKVEKELPTEGLLIFAIVIAIALVGFLNEYKAEKTIEALRKLVGQNAKVKRNGQIINIPAGDLVPGDVVLLDEGAKIPADLRLVEVKQIKVVESSLTGESDAVMKNTDKISTKAALGDQTNMAFSGTFIASGTAIGVVVATGQKTEIGKIASLVNSVESDQTPMQKKLDSLGKQLGAGVIAICIVVFVAIFFLDREGFDLTLLQRLILAFTAAVALAVAAIPEGLAFVVRISLALGARRMANKNALVRKLSAVEALGSTDVICSDKTGTLTKGEMTVRNIWQNGSTYDVSGSGYSTKGEITYKGVVTKSADIEKLFLIGLLCNNSKLKEKDTILGDPTEAALLVSAAKYGLDTDFERLDEVPFSSDRKKMSTVHRDIKGYFVATKGAPEMVLASCKYVLEKGKMVELTKDKKAEILSANKELASQALRVLGFAYKHCSQKPNDKDAETELVFAGLQGMMDPPRIEVKEVVHRVQAEAGMRVVMITGDYIETAKAIAAELGIEGEALSGEDLDKLTPAQLSKVVEKTSVYARVNPEHKIRIVKALKKHGHQVAMTGDGVNDAPAIKAADIGIAMGITGTDAAKEASDMILLDDQFLTIINAIEEGRGIFDNVRKFVNYLLSANIAEVITIFLGVVVYNNLLLTAAQLLFVNIVTDGLPAVALGSDPAEKDVMRYKPKRFQGAILSPRIWAEMLIFGTMMSVVLLFMYKVTKDASGVKAAISAVFVGMVIFEMVRLVDIRTDYHIKWFSNPWLTVAMIASVILQLFVLYVPFLAQIFNVEPISATSWIIIAAASVMMFTVMKILNPILDRWQPETHPS
jgi:Ca2+-transporting ATPase